MKGRPHQSILKNFVRDRQGSVAVIGAVVLPIVLGMSALALEYGGALLARAETQRVADMAAYAAASVYSRSNDVDDMKEVGRSVARLNGIEHESITISLPDGSASGGVRATITTKKPLLLARALTVLPGVDSIPDSLDVNVTALAAPGASEPACVIALDADGAGVTLSGGATLRSEDCAVASNTTVVAPSDAIITKTVIYNSETPPSDGSIKHPDGGIVNKVQAETEDPFAGHPAILAANARMTVEVESLSPPLVPAGPDINFTSSGDTNAIQKTIDIISEVGCDASKQNSNTWDVSCIGQPSYNFGKITVQGGQNLNFNIDYGVSPLTVYHINGSIIHNGGTVRFGPGVYKIRNGIVASGGTAMQFGTGEMNSFYIGSADDGKAINFTGAELIFGDALGAHSVFKVVGNIESGGGGCLKLPAASQHDIAGHIYLGGAGVFGSGIYTIDGYLHFGQGGGCPDSGVDQLAGGVTFVLSGKGLPTTHWACGNKVFCIKGGQSIRLQAPISGDFANIAVIGPTDPGNSNGALLTAGASGSQVSGLFYIPNGPFEMSGGASVGSGSSGCFQLVASEVKLSGGTSAASECVTADGGAAGQVRLLQ